MKKFELFPIFDKQQRQLKQVNALSNVLQLAGGLNTYSKDDVAQCMSLVCELAEQVQTNHEFISRALTELYIVDSEETAV